MSRRPIVASFLIALAIPATAQRSFEPDRWSVSSPGWIVSDSLIRVDTRAYDQILASPRMILAKAPWSLTVELRGRRAGVCFGLADTLSARSSHMVRFDDRSILVGWFNGGGVFSATGTFDSPVDPEQWVSLRVEVHPEGGWYDVFVNGQRVGRDSTLVYRSGYAGLQASDGTAEFRSFRAEGLPARTAFLPAIGTIVKFDHLRHLERHGPEACGFDEARKVWVLFDRRGRVLRTHRSAELPTFQRSMMLGRRTYAIAGSLVKVRDQRGRLVDSLSGRFRTPVALLRSGSLLLVSDPGVNAVLEFDARGRFRRSHRAMSAGGFRSVGGMVALPSGEVAVADNDRIVLIRPGTDEPTLRVQPREGELVVRRSDGKILTVLQATPDSPNLKARVSRDGTGHITGIEPMTTVRFTAGPLVPVVPPSLGRPSATSYTTSPREPGRMAVRRLRILYLVYRTVNYRDVYPRERFPQVPDGRTLTDDDIAYLRRAAEFNREFYFRNSSCRLALDFDVVVIDEPLRLSEVGARDPYWLEPRERVVRDLEQACKRLDELPESYSGVICTYAWVNYPPRRTSALRDPSGTDSIRIRQAYGGGSYGVPAPWKYGVSAGYTGNPFQDRFSRQDWLITHEFHHQLDALMDRSGYPEYDHADEPWKMPGQFGEDFDFNAHILRRAVPSSWLDLAFGTLVSVADADRDGVPDDDPTLPFDERRLGSSARSKDTDGDGLDDLQEIMAGTSHGASPSKRDTDGDGLRDGRDPEPLIPYRPFITRAPKGASPTPAVFAADTLEGVATELRMSWTPEALLIEVRTDRPANILFQLDANNDGWFHGFDNLQVRIVRSGDSVVVQDAYLRDCSSWVDSPHDRRDLFTPADILMRSWSARVADVPSLSKEIVRFTIPRRDAFGMTWQRGKRLSFRFGVQTETDLWVWKELFERNRMMSVELQ